MQMHQQVGTIEFCGHRCSRVVLAPQPFQSRLKIINNKCYLPLKAPKKLPKNMLHNSESRIVSTPDHRFFPEVRSHCFHDGGLLHHSVWMVILFDIFQLNECCLQLALPVRCWNRCRKFTPGAGYL